MCAFKHHLGFFARFYFKDGELTFINNIFFDEQQRSVLFTVGEDETASPQLSSICLKAFDLDKMEQESSSTTSPFCIQILRIFTNQFPEAKVTTISSFGCHMILNMPFSLNIANFLNLHGVGTCDC